MKDKEWLKEEVFELYPSYDVIYDVSPDYEAVAKTETISKVLELIDQLDEPERPVIPQFVADWIERQIKFGHEDVFISMTRQFIFPSSEIKNMGIRNFELEEEAE